MKLKLINLLLLEIVLGCKVFAVETPNSQAALTNKVPKLITVLESQPKKFIIHPNKFEKKSNLIVKPKKVVVKKTHNMHSSLIDKRFDFQYTGSLVGALYALKEYDPKLDILNSLGKKQNLQVNMDLTDTNINDVIDNLNQQANTNARVVFDSIKNTIRVYFDTHADFGADAVLESKKWQEGGNIRPVLTKDGVVLFPYGEQQMQVVCQPLQLCDISFEPGEYMMSKPVIGDSLRWIINDAVSQENSLTVQHLIVTPQSVGLNTSLLVPTNKRTYMIKLRSSEQGYVARVSFYYPKDFNINMQSVQEKISKQALSSVTEVQQAHLAPEKLDFNYELSNDKPNWKPIRVFSDDHLTYIQLPSGINAMNLPTLVVLGADGSTQQVVNFSIKDNFYIVEKIFDKAELILGNDRNQERVIITHTKPKKGFWSSIFG